MGVLKFVFSLGPKASWQNFANMWSPLDQAISILMLPGPWQEPPRQTVSVTPRPLDPVTGYEWTEIFFLAEILSSNLVGGSLIQWSLRSSVRMSISPGFRVLHTMVGLLEVRVVESQDTSVLTSLLEDIVPALILWWPQCALDLAILAFHEWHVRHDGLFCLAFFITVPLTGRPEILNKFKL